eukprot:SAG31_NODE_3722_length_3949_cov_7.490130_4_plen_49_part_00
MGYGVNFLYLIIFLKFRRGNRCDAGAKALPDGWNLQVPGTYFLKGINL